MKKVKQNLNSVYTLDLSYSKRDNIVDSIIRKIDGWKRTSEWSNISYIKREVNLGWFGRFKCTTKNLLVTVHSERYMKIICGILWIRFQNEKFLYEEDLFQLF